MIRPSPSDLLDKAGNLLAAAGRAEENGFRQSALAQASGILREVVTLLDDETAEQYEIVRGGIAWPADGQEPYCAAV